MQLVCVNISHVVNESGVGVCDCPSPYHCEGFGGVDSRDIAAAAACLPSQKSGVGGPRYMEFAKLRETKGRFVGRRMAGDAVWDFSPLMSSLMCVLHGAPGCRRLWFGMMIFSTDLSPSPLPLSESSTLE
jgi:hypothetical protein